MTPELLKELELKRNRAMRVALSATCDAMCSSVPAADLITAYKAIGVALALNAALAPDDSSRELMSLLP